MGQEREREGGLIEGGSIGTGRDGPVLTATARMGECLDEPLAEGGTSGAKSAEATYWTSTVVG